MITIEIINDTTGDEYTGHYNYAVYLNERRIATGHIEKHTRAWGWKALVYRLLGQEK